MLKIKRQGENASSIALSVEGKVRSDWVSILDREVRSALSEGRTVVLDLSGVSYVDSDGVDLLKHLTGEGVQITGCSSFILELLRL